MPGAENRAGQGKGGQPKKDYQPALTSELLGVMVGKSLNSLVEAIKTGNTQHLTSYLTFSSRFHRYSRRNQQLIFEQCPEATRVASYQKWKEEGFQVRKLDKAKGEQGIRILVPTFPKGFTQGERRRPREAQEEQTEEEYEHSESALIAHRFTVGTVFDVTHLIAPDQERVPQLFTPIHGDHDAVHHRLVAAVQREGIAYRESLDTEGARGYSAGGVIVVRADQPAGNKAAVTAHEWAHELLHKEAERQHLSKQVKECHAEATAFAVMSHFGIEIPYSAEYLIMWGNDTESMRKELDLVTAATSHILAKVIALEPGEYSHDRKEAEAGYGT